ncbi:hypothetical protein BJ508DRAFT_347624, partial [Ascobolus immersus RN42]
MPRKPLQRQDSEDLLFVSCCHGFAGIREQDLIRRGHIFSYGYREFVSFQICDTVISVGFFGGLFEHDSFNLLVVSGEAAAYSYSISRSGRHRGGLFIGELDDILREEFDSKSDNRLGMRTLVGLAKELDERMLAVSEEYRSIT